MNCIGIEMQMRDGMLESICRGSISTDDFQQLASRLHDLESRLDVTPDRVADLSDVTSFELQTKDIVAFAQRRKGAKLKNKVKSAINATQAAQYGLARMFQTYNQNPEIEILVFGDSESAYRWLGRDVKCARPVTDHVK